MIAKKINKRDVIGLVSPSDPVYGEEDFENLKLAKKKINSMGYSVMYGQNALNNTFGYSCSAIEKAEDINRMFADPCVAAIFAMCGGNNCFGCLPYIDYNLIKKNPKIVLGFSDITMLINAIYAKTGLVTFHGSNFIAGFYKRFEKYNTTEIINRLQKSQIGLINKKTEWTKIHSGVAEGVMFGGNLSIMSSLAGTEYMPDPKGKILFLEELGMESSPAEASKCAYILKYHKVFDKVKGVLIGNYEHESGVTLEQILMDEVLKDKNIPIIKCNDFGHGQYNTVLPVGAKARLDAEKCTLEILENCVKS